MLSKDRVQDDPFILASQVKHVFYVRDLVENDWYAVLKFPPKGLRNSNTYELENADLLSIVEFDGTKCKNDEAIGYGDMDYVQQASEGTCINGDK